MDPTTVYDDGGVSIVVVDERTVEVHTPPRLVVWRPLLYAVLAVGAVAGLVAVSVRHGWGVASWSMTPMAVVLTVSAVWLFRSIQRPTAQVDRDRWTVRGGMLVGTTELGGPPTVAVSRSRTGGWHVSLRGRRRSAPVTQDSSKRGAEPVADRLAEVLGVRRER